MEISLTGNLTDLKINVLINEEHLDHHLHNISII